MRFKVYDKDYPVTSCLIIITVLVFVLMFFRSGTFEATSQTIYDFGGVYGREINLEFSQIWRIVAAIFVHIRLEHILLNSLTLFFVGKQAERIFGSLNFLVVYLLSGIMGNLFVLFFSPDSISAGASTSLFGLFSAIVTLRYASRNPEIQHLGKAYFELLLINIVFSFLPGISLAGHLGGLVGGVLCAFIFPIRYEGKVFGETRSWLALIVYLVLAILLVFLPRFNLILFR